MPFRPTVLMPLRAFGLFLRLVALAVWLLYLARRMVLDHPLP